jgi:hypothetical protein
MNNKPICCNHNCNQGRNCPLRKINANELADELDKSRQEPFTSEYLVGQAATMLRQQQAEIEKLKVEKIRAYDNGYEDGRKPDTNPKPAKTLTDEEINQVAIDMGMFGDLSHDEIELCKNVLRKAQKK